DHGGQVGGELEQGGGASSAGLDAELAQPFDHPEGAQVLSGSSAGEQPGGFMVAADGGVTGSGLDEFADHLVERLGDQDRFSTESQPRLRPGDLDVVNGELADGGGGLGVEQYQQAGDAVGCVDVVVVQEPAGLFPTGFSVDG